MFKATVKSEQSQRSQGESALLPGGEPGTVQETRCGEWHLQNDFLLWTQHRYINNENNGILQNIKEEN